MASAHHSLETIPPELLEHIAFHVAASNPLGPPSGLVPLLRTSRHVHDALSITHNPHLYARVFSCMFDFSAVKRRFGIESLPSEPLAQELKRRCIVLKRIKAQVDCLQTGNPELVEATSPNLEFAAEALPSTSTSRVSRYPGENTMLDEVLWVAYLMMLENDGMNERQLRAADIEAWLDTYWFNPAGASSAIQTAGWRSWPPDTERNGLAMWLYWLTLDLSKHGQPASGHLDSDTVSATR